MDKLFHFKPKNTQNSNLKHLTQDQAGFYSEEEGSSTTKQSNAKKSQFQQQKNANEFNQPTLMQQQSYNKPEIRNRNVTANIQSDAGSKKIQIQRDNLKQLEQHQYRHLIFSENLSEETFKKHLTLTYRGLVYAKKCLKGPSDKFIQTKLVSVKDAKNPTGRTLLLDLDETLIHSCGLKENPDHIITAFESGSNPYQIGFRVRPYCLEFLQVLVQYWDIYIFTASSPSYASAIIKFLDPEGKYINGILNRNNCMETKNGFFIKDLRIIKGKDIKKTILVDNLAHSFGFQIENGVPILEWFQDRKDTELKGLIDYLIEAAQCNDVRVFNEERLQLSQLAELKVEQL